MPVGREPANALALLSGRVIGAVTSLVVVGVAAHRLDVVEFGLVASTMAGGFLANMFVTFGTDTVITRAVAAGSDDARAVIARSLRLQFGLALALIAVAGATVLLGANGIILVQAIALVPMAVVTVAGAVLRGAQQMGRLLVAVAAGASGTILVLLAIFETRSEPWVPIAAVATGATITAVTSTWFARRSVPPGVGSSSARLLIRETAPFAAMVVLAGVGTQGGLLLVEFASDETAGGYGVAVRLVEAARLVPAAAMGAFFPAMLSGLHGTDRYRRWRRWLFAYAAAATIALLTLAGPINRIVFDDQPGGATLTRILALGLVVTVARLALSFELIADGRERIVLVGALAATLVMAAAGLAVAPRYGAEGIAWSQLGGLAVGVAILSLIGAGGGDSNGGTVRWARRTPRAHRSAAR